MNWDIIIVLLILISFFAGLIIFVKKAPVFFAKYRAKTFGLDLTIEEAEIILKNFCLKKEFLEGVNGIWSQQKISIEKLATHYLASGNLHNIQEGIKELNSRNRNIDFNILSAIDLAGKNLKSEILSCDQEHLVRIDEQENDSLKIFVTAKYKFGFPDSIWAEKQPEQIQQKVEEKVARFLNSHENSEPLESEKFLRENILNNDFWENEVKLVLVEQDIRLMNKK
ncbi:MAG: hypothetical protein ACFCUU_04380 [Cyclobacteriaceae bacterium]